ncbi:MAG: hypothetical protein AABX71_01880 [Nanoarchaeota archaeon]
MNYTASKKADEQIEKELKIIKKIIIDELNPVSIILFGGFGRGEGSFEIVERKVKILNDYDLYVVSNGKIPNCVLDKVGRKCSRAIGKGGGEFVEEFWKIYDKNRYFHVDLRGLRYSELGKLKRTNRTYELKYGSRIIYGEDVRNRIREVELPVSEAFRCLMIPACHLLLCMDERRLKGEFKGDEKFYLKHHIIKTYLAIAYSLNISAGRFQATYKKNVEEFKKIYGKRFPELAEKVEEALKFKLKGGEFKDIKKRWFSARDDLTFTLSFLAEKHLSIKRKDIQGLVAELYKKLPYVYFTPYLPLPEFLAELAFPAQYYLNILYFKRTGYLKSLLKWRDIGLRIGLSAFLLLHAVDKNLTDETYSYIKEFSPVKKKSWKDLRISLLYAFSKYFLQKLI